MSLLLSHIPIQYCKVKKKIIIIIIKKVEDHHKRSDKWMIDCCLVAQSCPTLCVPMDCSTLGCPALVWMTGVSERVKSQQRYTANIKHYDAKFSVKKDFGAYACNDW